MTIFDHVDLESLSVILKLQNDDVQELLQQTRGAVQSSVDGSTTGSLNSELAIDRQAVDDRKMAFSDATAVLSDAHIIQQYQYVEHMAESDRAIARQVERGREIANAAIPERDRSPDGDLVDRLARM